MSSTAEPVWSASNVTLVIVHVLGARMYVITPGVMTAPPPANTAVKFKPACEVPDVPALPD